MSEMSLRPAFGFRRPRSDLSFFVCKRNLDSHEPEFPFWSSLTQTPIMSKCSECAGAVVWNEDASSNICISCGSLTDPSQRVLANNDDQLDSQYFNPSAPNSLKRLRGGSSWALAGESKEARVKNNTVRFSTSLIMRS